MNRFTLLMVLYALQTVTGYWGYLKYFYESDPVKINIGYRRKFQSDIPIIEPKVEDITLDYGTNFNITCSHIWYKFLHNYYPFSGLKKLSGHLLTIVNASEKDVGEYICANEEFRTDFEDISERKIKFYASSIYVYVNDPNVRLVPMPTQYTIRNNEPGIIPCKPTTKNTQVQLIKKSGSFDLTITDYNPAFGFEVMFSSINDEGHYVCITNNDTQNGIEFYLRVETLYQLCTYPDTRGYVVHGENLTLKCYYNPYYVNKYTFDFLWTQPNKNTVSENNTHQELLKYRELLELIIYNADRNNDQGYYTCKMSLNENNTGTYIKNEWTNENNGDYYAKNLWIDVISPNETYLKILKSIGKSIWNDKTQSFSSRWIIPYIGNYYPDFLWFDNNQKEIQILNDSNKYVITRTKTHFVFQINNIDFLDHGNYTMKDKNHSETIVNKELIVIDIPKVTMSNVLIKENQQVQLICSSIGFPIASHTFTFSSCSIFPRWPNCSFSNQLVNGYEFSHLNSSILKKTSIIFTPSGPMNVTCFAKNPFGENQAHAFVMIADIDEQLEVWLIGSKSTLFVNESLTIVCAALGYNSTGDLEWYKDGELVKSSSVIIISRNDTKYSYRKEIYFKKLTVEDSGIYECQGTFINKTKESKSLSVIVKEPLKSKPEYDEEIFKKRNKPLNQIWQIGISIIVFILISGLLIYMAIRIKKLSRNESYLKSLLDGSGDQINPDLFLDEQVYLLPYNSKYEFPRDRLKLGPKLGEGAFGIVFKGLAQQIISNIDQTVVAVKTMKGNATNEMIRGFVSELKIMIYIGQHLNVVNVLGAITKNIVNREMMIITEYCRYGNLQTFIFKHRSNFVDQINSETAQIELIKLTKKSNKTEYLDYLTVGQSHTNETNSEENNSIFEAWHSNYKTEDLELDFAIKTSDLISWGFQVACGMEYLASRKVLHGDLAARNVLLCEQNVVKICDFGLARSLYKNENYIKEGKSLLPFKWLAIESIENQVFSQYSDVWSFGIFLFELFSLAKTPYPGMAADHVLFNKLLKGYRMEKPDYANQEIYELMLNCWNLTPETRPVFSKIVNILEQMLEDDVKSEYLALNEPYVRMNTEMNTDYMIMNAKMMSPDQMGYLNMTGKPKIDRPYINEHFELSMRQSTIKGTESESSISSNKNSKTRISKAPKNAQTSTKNASLKET